MGFALRQSVGLRSSGPVVTLKRLPYPGTPLTVGTDSSAVLYYTLLLQRIAYYYDSVASPALSRQYTQRPRTPPPVRRSFWACPPPAWQTPRRGQQWKP